MIIFRLLRDSVVTIFVMKHAMNNRGRVGNYNATPCTKTSRTLIHKRW